MNILAVTLVRAGSKGCPGKHARILGGKPVIRWTIDSVQGSQYITDYVISTNDEEVAGIAVGIGVEVLKRPAELCEDSTPTLPALQWTIVAMEAKKGTVYDYVVEVRATSPLKTTRDIDQCIETLVEGGYDSVIGVTPIPEDHHPARVKWISSRGFIRDFIPEPAAGRRQDLAPKAYVRNGTVYALKRNVLFGDKAMLFGHLSSFGVVMPPERSVNIDTEDDWELCCRLVR